MITVGDYLGPTAITANPLEFCYFTTLTDDVWRRAKALAKRATDTLVGGMHHDYMRSHGPVEKAGEFVFKGFLDYYCRAPYDVNFTDGDQFVPGFSIAGTTVDVHTRMFKRSTGGTENYPLINTRKFLLMVPELGLARRPDIYMFCGYNVENRYGYAFGWATAEEIAELPLANDLRHKAKCLSLYKIHPMHTLLGYIAP